MKKIFRNLMFGLTVAAGAIFSSCSTTDEVMDSIPYNRVLTPLNFSATVVASTGTDVTFRWDLMQNAEAYELQIFQSDSEPDYDAAEPVESYLVEIDEVPYTVPLIVDNTYYARVRGISSRIEASNWAYPDKGDRSVKTYAVRPSLNPVIIARSQTELTIGWDDADDKTDLTFLSVAKVLDSKNSDKIDFTAADIENCSITVSDLEPGTEYKLTLIFGKAGERGYVTAWTRPEMGQVVEVNTVKGIVDNIEGATGELRLKVAYNDGAEYNFAEVLTDPENNGVKALSVGCPLYIFGDASEDGKKPVLTKLQLSLAEGTTALHLEDLSLNGANTMGTAVEVVSAPKLSVVEMINCELYDYTKAIYSTAASVTTDVDKLFFSGIYAHDINANGSQGGDFIDVRSAGSHSVVEVVNSTFYAVARTFLRVSDNAKNNTVSVDNCTFNFVTATDSSSNNSGIFHVRTDTTGTQSITCSNSLFMNMFNEKEDKDASGWIRIARDNATQSGAPACENNYYYHVGKVFLTTRAVVPQTGEQFSAEGWTELTEDPCVNSDAGKLYLTNSVIAEKQVGDPRWWNATQPKVERATELETVTETTVWDFTDKTKYDTESVEANTIIQNMRIYAPAEIVMSQGITFAAAAEVGSNGRPTSNALGFKAEGYGSVTVATLDGGYNATVNVVVGEDRITLPADGAAHKAVFGDLKGENEIFVLAGSAVTITSVTWTAEDAEAEDTKKALAAPAVKLSVTSFEEGNEDGLDVVASWDAVDNADKYEVTFNGQTVETSETSFTVSAADAAALAVGDYEISVTAYPVASSSKYKASEATVVSFKVKEKPLPGGTVVLTWDFSSEAWQSVLSTYGESGKDIPNWDVNIDGLQWYSPSNSRWTATSIQSGNAGSTTDRYFKFTAPAAGTLKVWSSNTGGSEAADRGVTVNVGGVETKKFGGSASSVQTENEFDVDEAGDVYIYAYGGGLRFYKIEFTYIDGAAAAPEPSVWDFSSTEWQSVLSTYGESGKDIPNWDVNIDGLQWYSPSNSRWTATSIQSGNAGSTTDRYFKFKATSAGTLKVWSSNTGGSEAADRGVTVNVGGVETKKFGGSASSVQTENEFDVDEAGDVYIYAYGGGLRFYKIEFDGAVEK